MNSKQKGWLLVGPVIFSFAMAMTTPVVHVYFMRLIDASVLAVANMISVGIATMTNTSVTRNGFLEWYDKHFTLNDSYTDDNACVDGIRAWLEQE